MESAADAKGPHTCPKCSLLPNRNAICSANRSKISRARMAQWSIRVKNILILIVSICLVGVSVGIMTEFSFQRGLGVLLLAVMVYFALGALLNAEDTVKELGYYALPGFTGHLMWYGFICTDCGEESCDYVHGYDAYITCQSCGTNLHVRSKRFYTNDGRPAPSRRRELLDLWRMSRKLKRTKRISEIEAVEAMGVRVVVPVDKDLKRVVEQDDENLF